MTRDPLPPTMGAVIGLGAAVAVAVSPATTWMAAATAGTAMGLLAYAAFRAMPRWLRIDEPPPGDDDGSGERPVWSSRETEALSPFTAWSHGDSVLPGVDDTREMPAPAAARAVLHNADLFRPRGYRGGRRAGQMKAGAR